MEDDDVEEEEDDEPLTVTDVKIYRKNAADQIEPQNA